VYNASNNELVRTKSLMKNCIVQVDATPFKQFYSTHYGLPKDFFSVAEPTDVVAKASGRITRKREKRLKTRAAVDGLLKDQLIQGACVCGGTPASRAVEVGVVGAQNRFRCCCCYCPACAGCGGTRSLPPLLARWRPWHGSSSCCASVVRLGCKGDGPYTTTAPLRAFSCLQLL
jgi:ribosomal protein S8E